MTTEMENGMAARTIVPATQRAGGKATNRRPEIEEWLDSFEVEWSYVPDAPIADIDEIRSLKNQARISPIDEETVERYEIAWRTKATFPPIVTNAGGRTSKQTMINGNHRLVSAIKAGVQTLDRYEVRNAKPATIAAMCREANNINGLPPSEAERILSAIFASKSQGISLKKAADQFQVPLAKVQRKHAESSALERAQSLGLDMHGFMGLSQAVRGRLVPLQPDEVYGEAAKLAIKANLTVDQAKELVVALNDARSFAQKMAIIKAWERSLKDQIQANLGGRKTSNSKRPMTRKQRFQMAVGQIRTFGDDVEGLLDAYSDVELPDLVDDVETVIEKLQKLTIEAKART